MREPSGDAALAASMSMVDVLVRRGLAGVCISPGSRSTPLVLAFARDGRVPVRVVLDERSAGFIALGLAKATGRSAAVVSTSGTAAANFLPAVVEASQSRTPLIVLSADRPARLRGTGANQTIDQRGLYGVYARAFFGASSWESWATLGVEAFDTAMRAPAGPVHVNVPFDEPLVPSGTPVEPERIDVQSWSPPKAEPPSEEDLDLLADACRAERGVIVAGPMPARAAALMELASALAWPLLAEPASNLQGLTAGETVIGGFRPEVVVQFGTTPTTRAMQAFVASADRLLVVDPDGRRQDPAGVAERTIAADPDALARAVLARGPGREPSPWLGEWNARDKDVRAQLDADLDAQAEPSELRVARDVAACLPPGATLIVGNSGPVRDLAVGMHPREGLRVLGNRGASGIDGLVSTVLGVAWSGAPTVGLIGDLTLLHDLGGFAWSAARGLDAVLVVLNNGGGAIFDRLPTASLPEHEEYFVTPHGLDLGALVRAAGAGHERVSAAADIGKAVLRALVARGVRVVEVVVLR